MAGQVAKEESVGYENTWHPGVFVSVWRWQ